MEWSFEDCEVARRACAIAARHDEERAAQAEGEGREALLAEARRFRQLSERLARVKRPHG
jgi:hypothetical protein